jgi:hypothetical protein
MSMNDANSQFKLIVNKPDELFYNDGNFLDKCQLLIFKPDVGQDIDRFDRIDRKVASFAKATKGKVGGELLEALRSFEDEPQDASPLFKFMYLQDFKNKNEFSIYKRILENSFSSVPDVPSHIERTLEINSPEDMKRLISSGYEVFAFTSYQQYGKVVAEYLIQNKELYKIEKSDIDIFNEWVHPQKMKRYPRQDISILEEVWDDLEKAGVDLLKTHDKSVWIYDENTHIDANEKIFGETIRKENEHE